MVWLLLFFIEHLCRGKAECFFWGGGWSRWRTPESRDQLLKYHNQLSFAPWLPIPPAKPGEREGWGEGDSRCRASRCCCKSPFGVSLSDSILLIKVSYPTLCHSLPKDRPSIFSPTHNVSRDVSNFSSLGTLCN